MTKTVKRAALYIRVSTDEQARYGLSLGEQRRDLEDYARRKGYIVAGIYADEGTSARKSLHRRKELQRLLADIRAGKIDVVVVKDLERWMRSVRDFYKVQDILDEHNVGWECSQDRYNTTTANGKMQLNMRLAIAQDESDRDSERIRYVFEGKRKRKEVLSGAIPRGMSIVDKHIVFNEEADMVRAIFNHVYNGGSVRSCIALAKEEYGVELTYRTIRRSLANRAYIGELHGEPGYIESMIPLDVFNRVQIKLKKYCSSFRNKSTGSRVYLFTGLISCPHCGSTLSGYRGDKKADGTYRTYWYRCGRANGNAGVGCNYTRCLYERKVESFLLDNIQSLLSNHMYQIEQRRIAKQKFRSEMTEENIQAKLARLKDLYVDGLIDKPTYLRDYNKFQQQLLEIASDEVIPLTTIPPEAQSFVSSADFREVYQSLTQENKRDFWASIIKRITYEDTPATHGRGGVYDFHVEFY